MELFPLFGATSTFSGPFYNSDGTGCTNGKMSASLKWYTDEARTQLADLQPTPTENVDNTYVFITSQKFDSGPTFPAGTHVWFGTSDGEYALAPTVRRVRGIFRTV